MSRTAPQASIVIPLLRQVDVWLEQAVMSAITQTVPCDVLIVTSPHTPESNHAVLAKVQRSHPELRIIEREPHMRFAAALNLGIRRAEADRIGFLLTDDWLEPAAVEKCLPCGADIVSTGSRGVAADGFTELREAGSARTQARYEKLESLADKAAYLGYFLVFRRRALADVGGVDETIGDSPGIDDLDLPWCMLENGATTQIVSEPLYNIRDHDGERLTTRKREDMMAVFLRILDKHNVQGDERDRLTREQSVWFGKPVHQIAGPPPNLFLRPFQSLYRFAVPLRTRLALHDRWIAAFAKDKE